MLMLASACSFRFPTNWEAILICSCAELEFLQLSSYTVLLVLNFLYRVFVKNSSSPTSPSMLSCSPWAERPNGQGFSNLPPTTKKQKKEKKSKIVAPKTVPAKNRQAKKHKKGEVEVVAQTGPNPAKNTRSKVMAPSFNTRSKKRVWTKHWTCNICCGTSVKQFYCALNL